MHTLGRRFSCAAFALLSLAATGAQAANLLSNGSFEAGTFVDNGQHTSSLVVGSGAMTAWTIIGDTVAWIETGNPFSLSANDGARFLDLTDYATGAPFGGVQQAVATVIGQSYVLSFDLGSSSLDGRPSAITATAAASSQTFTSPFTGGSNDWQTVSMSFVATSTTTVISLLGSDGVNYIGLDNVVLISAVPEPMSAALWLAGLAMTSAAVARRRRHAD